MTPFKIIHLFNSQEKAFQKTMLYNRSNKKGREVSADIFNDCRNMEWGYIHLFNII